MIPGFQPMLAAKDASKLRFPLMASVKIDGVRAVVMDGKVYSRSLKLIPNPHVQALFGRPEYEGFDGELVVGPANAPNVMQATTSGVMSKKGTPHVHFYVFDLVLPGVEYHDRNVELGVRVMGRHNDEVQWLPQVNINEQAELDEYEAAALERGYEGVMVRSRNGLYKFGRSTAKEGGLVKIKRFEDAEAVVVGTVERMHNENEATINELGRTKRSTCKAGKVPAGDLGALTCLIERAEKCIRFDIGTGFTAEQRRQLWAQRDSLVGRIVKYKSFEAVGVLEAPRFPVFIGFRDERDL